MPIPHRKDRRIYKTPVDSHFLHSQLSGDYPLSSDRDSVPALTIQDGPSGFKADAVTHAHAAREHGTETREHGTQATADHRVQE